MRTKLRVGSGTDSATNVRNQTRNKTIQHLDTTLMLSTCSDLERSQAPVKQCRFIYPDLLHGYISDCIARSDKCTPVPLPRPESGSSTGNPEDPRPEIYKDGTLKFGSVALRSGNTTAMRLAQEIRWLLEYLTGSSLRETPSPLRSPPLHSQLLVSRL